MKASEEDALASSTPDAAAVDPAEPLDPPEDPASVTGLVVVVDVGTVDEGEVVVVVFVFVVVVVVVVDDGVVVLLVVVEPARVVVAVVVALVVDVGVVETVSVASQQAVLLLGARSMGMSDVDANVSVSAATSIDVGLPMHEAGNSIENRSLAKVALGVHCSTWLFAPRICVASVPTPPLANCTTKLSFVGSEFPLVQMPQFTKKEDPVAVGSTGSAVWSVRVICPSWYRSDSDVMLTSGLAGVPSVANGEGRPAATVIPLVVADAERGSTNSSAERPRSANPTRGRATLLDHRTLRNVPLASVVGEGRQWQWPARCERSQPHLFRAPQ